MEFLTPETGIFLFLIAMTAGFVDSIAGGGGLLALPALLWAGLPPSLALGTTKLQGSFGTFSASYNFIKKGQVNLKEMKFIIFCTLVGSVAGAVLVQVFKTDFLSDLIPILLIATAIYFIFSPQAKEIDPKQRISSTAFAWLAGFGLGFYDGFFGPGSGSFIAIVHVWLMGFNLTKATAHTKVLNLTSNLAALVAFIIGDSLVWSLGFIMACGQFIGARLGSNLVIAHGAKMVRPLIIIVSLALTAKLIISDETGFFHRLFMNL